MKQFILIYKGRASDMSQMSEDQQKAVLDDWRKWVAKTGDALVDTGSPFGEGASIADDGSETDPTPLSGYSILQANNLTVAKQLCQGHPFLSAGEGKYSIEIYELLPVPF